MLRLVSDHGEGNREDSTYAAPKYIALPGTHNVMGRGYQAEIRLTYPWLSRKHLSITRVDGNAILEVQGQTGVYVNDKNVEFITLKEGDIITIGGGKKKSPIGSAFVAAGPHVIYSYHKSAKLMTDKENCYKNEPKPQDIITVPDVVNGHVVNQSYHMEDFNGTDELTRSDSAHNMTLVSEPCPVPKSTETLGNKSEIPCKKTDSTPGTSSSTEPLTPSVSVSESAVSNKLNVAPIAPPTPPPTPLEAENMMASPMINGRKKRKTRAAATACKDMLSAKLGKMAKGKKKEEALEEGEGGCDKKAESVALKKGKSAVPKAVETVASKPTSKEESVADETKITVQAEVYTAPPGISGSSVKAEADDVKVELNSEKTEKIYAMKVKKNVKGLKAETDAVKTEANSANPSATTTKQEKSFIPTEPTSTSCYKPWCAEEEVIEVRTDSQDVQAVEPFRISDDEDDDDDSWKPGAGEKTSAKKSETSAISLPRPSMRKRKRISYILSDNDDSDYKPDKDEEDDCEVVTGSSAVRSLKDIIQPSKKMKLEAKGKGKGKATPKARAKNKNTGPSEQEIEEQKMISEWFIKPVPTPKPRIVEVLNGKFRKSLFSFADKEVFTVVYKNGEDLTQKNLWETEEYDVIVTLDAALFEHKLRVCKIQQEDLTRVLRLIRKSVTTLNMKDYDQPTPATKFKHVQKPEAIQLDLKKYQMDTLGLMVLVENQVGRMWTVSKLAEWMEAESQIMFDVCNRRVYFPPIPSIPSTEYQISIKGGILADEMGLGKTITMLSLVAANQGLEFPRIPPPEAFRNHEEMQIPTRATLVIAPSHLTAQWKQEAQTHAPSMKVIIITTKTQFEKVTYADVLQSDLVIVSVQFLLTNKAYSNLPTGADAEASFMELLHNPGINPLLQKCPNFCHFEWWRLVCDEAHELITYESKYNGKKGYEMQCSQGLQTLAKLSARHKWYMTGTPFPHGEKSLRGALKFLEMKIDDESLTYPDGSIRVDQDVSSYQVDFAREGLYLTPIHRFILDTVYVRNTKQSIGLEYNVPEYVEELMLLTQSDVEKGIYDRASTELERRQLCCHLQIAARVQMIAGVQQKSLEEVKEAMINHARQEIERTKRNIEFTKQDIAKAKTEYAAEDRANYRTMINSRINRYKDSIKSNEALIVKHNASLAYFENIVPRITQSADEPCVICFDKIERLTLTPCGHLYCRKCITTYVQQQSQCPTCRKQVLENQLVEVQDPNQRANLQKSNELLKLTEEFGTKMAYLIFFLRHLFKTDPNSRCIVFSQWDELLHKIGNTLNDNGIRNVFVKGNVHVRNKAIMSFRKQEKTRVIMLSLQNAASGTSLVEASHVILIDPVAGTEAEAKAIESQAIGRAHRMGQDKEIRVVRIIMKDTIEHQLYSRNNANDIQQVELNFDETEEVNSHGMQVIRKVRKVPKPEALIVPGPSAVGTSSPSVPSYLARNTATKKAKKPKAPKQPRGRRRWGWGGFGRRRNLFLWGGDDEYDDDNDGCGVDGCPCGMCY